MTPTASAEAQTGTTRRRGGAIVRAGHRLDGVSDERLSALAGGGSEEAFSAIVRRHRSALLRYCRTFVPDAQAEEVVQQAFLDLWSRLDGGEEIRSVRPWLYRVVHNGALNVIRRADYRCEEIGEGASNHLAPDTAYELRESARRALDGFASLPETQRSALIQSAFAGSSRTQIAAMMGTSEGAVGQLLRRARVTMRAAMATLTPWPLTAAAAALRRALATAGARLGVPASRLLGWSGAVTAGSPAGFVARACAALAAAVVIAAPIVASRAAGGTSAPAPHERADRIAARPATPRLTLNPFGSTAGAERTLRALGSTRRTTGASRAPAVAAASEPPSPPPDAAQDGEEQPAAAPMAEAAGEETASAPEGPAPEAPAASEAPSAGEAEPAPEAPATQPPTESPPASEAEASQPAEPVLSSEPTSP